MFVGSDWGDLKVENFSSRWTLVMFVGSDWGDLKVENFSSRWTLVMFIGSDWGALTINVNFENSPLENPSLVVSQLLVTSKSPDSIFSDQVYAVPGGQTALFIHFFRFSFHLVRSYFFEPAFSPSTAFISSALWFSFFISTTSIWVWAFLVSKMKFQLQPLLC
jgi:hypothetical protein